MRAHTYAGTHTHRRSQLYFICEDGSHNMPKPLTLVMG